MRQGVVLLMCLLGLPGLGRADVFLGYRAVHPAVWPVVTLVVTDMPAVGEPPFLAQARYELRHPATDTRVAIDIGRPLRYANARPVVQLHATGAWGTFRQYLFRVRLGDTVTLQFFPDTGSGFGWHVWINGVYQTVYGLMLGPLDFTPATTVVRLGVRLGGQISAAAPFTAHASVEPTDPPVVWEPLTLAAQGYEVLGDADNWTVARPVPVTSSDSPRAWTR